MAELDISKFKFYSIGIVVKDKERNTDMIIVHPSEVLPNINGPIKDYQRKLDVNVPDVKGVPHKQTTVAEATLEAKWLGLSCHNRATSPNVKANESVMLFQYAESTEFYWDKIGREPSIRRLEDVLYIYGGIDKYGVEQSLENSYWCRVNTIDKKVQIHTSMSNNEKFNYDIIIDTLSGILTITDSVENNIVIDSNEKSISIHAKIINLNADDSINLKTKTINTESNTTNNKADNINNTADITVKGNTTNTGNINTTGNVNTVGGSDSTQLYIGGVEIFPPPKP